MLIQPEKLGHWIKNFYGYGSWNAKFWFVGYEEGGGDLPEEVADKMNYFFTKHPGSVEPTLCDIRDLYKQVRFPYDGPKSEKFTTLHDYRFERTAIQHNVWKNLVTFIHGYRGKKLPDLFKYQLNKFATDNEALIQLYPLPSPHNHAWYYSWLDMPEFSFLKSRTLYEDHVYQNRIASILKNVILYKPEIVLMYGMNNINTLKNSIQEFFPGVKFKMTPATKLEIPQHHRTDLGGTTMIITTQIPALRHNRVETGFDWLEFGKKVKTTS
ncbi:MAG TPA: hypothetical protein VFE50_09630 [Cyclobacteriaceae bacterium]|nr:hypothetical protein [Cyclobacteriaceae bacterium]